ncbi:MAG: class I SAM-dependent methyltransferase [Candidatus Eremiobacteraeota bacterium]|nr:class I SAM-dependent methyltransferase [Candidatus Eremiobacteraeota bacterium]
MSALEKAKEAAFLAGQYVAQESFVSADEIMQLARSGEVESGSRVLDLCCGIGGPALHLVSETNCDLLGVDLNEASIETARRRAQESNLRAEFLVAEVPPKLDRRFDQVMVLETVLAFRDKKSLLRSIHGLLEVHGCLLVTLEEGAPLNAREQRRMPHSDTVWLTPLDDFLQLLNKSGFAVKALMEFTESHRLTASRLAEEYRRNAEQIGRELGPATVSGLIESHELWSEWMENGRVRKYGIVAEKD